MPASPVRTAASLNLFRIRFPIGAVASISHRISGAALVLCLPLAVEAFVRSIGSEADYEALRSWLRSPWIVPVLALPCWALLQHILAGMRHLLMDVDIGSALRTARRSAWLVLIAAPAAAVVVLWGLAP